MCGRFASYKNLNKLKNIFNICNSDFKTTQSYNISPGQDVNIVLNYKLDNYLLSSNWGYNFINSKILDLLVMSPWFTESLTYFVFYITGALLLYGAIGILIGVPNYVPLLHGACVFHVGKPKTDR